MQPTEHDAGCPFFEERLDPECVCEVDERCWLCEEPLTADHLSECEERGRATPNAG